MKRSLAAVAVTMTAALGACHDPVQQAAEAKPAPAAEARVVTPSRPASTPVRTDGTPAFAEIYPGARLEGNATTAAGAQGQGGMVTFTTEDAPDQVIAFYRTRAQSAGLSDMMALNQGAVQGYGAGRQADGASLNVVASPVEDRTSVQLTWSAGQ